MNGSTKTRLGIDTLETRECPAAFVAGDGYCGTPWPAPRPLHDLITVSRATTVTVPGPGDITLSPQVLKGVIVVGG